MLPVNPKGRSSAESFHGRSSITLLHDNTVVDIFEIPGAIMAFCSRLLQCAAEAVAVAKSTPSEGIFKHYEDRNSRQLPNRAIEKLATSVM